MRIAISSLLLVFVVLLNGEPNGELKPQHINFTAPLLAINGKEMRNGDTKDAPVMTLGDAAVNALETMLDEDRNLSGGEKFKRDQLARRIVGQKDVVLSVEETALIKDRIGKVYTPIVVGAAWPLLDPAMAEKPGKK